MAEDQTMEHPLGADGTSRASGESVPILPPRPTPTQANGVLRQSDLPALPAPVPGHGFIYRLLDPITAEPRYVGRSRTLAIRRHGHRSRRSKKQSPVTAWHRRLALHGLIPVKRCTRRAAVIGIPHPELGEEVAAAVALKPVAAVSTGELRDYVRSPVASC